MRLQYLGLCLVLLGINSVIWALHNAWWEWAGCKRIHAIVYNMVMADAIAALGFIMICVGIMVAHAVSEAVVFARMIPPAAVVLFGIDLVLALILDPDLHDRHAGHAYPFVATVSPTLQIPFSVWFPLLDWTEYVCWLRIHPWVATSVGSVAFLAINVLLYYWICRIPRGSRYSCPMCGAPTPVTLRMLGRAGACPHCAQPIVPVAAPPSADARPAVVNKLFPVFFYGLPLALLALGFYLRDRPFETGVSKEGPVWYSVTALTILFLAVQMLFPEKLSRARSTVLAAAVIPLWIICVGDLHLTGTATSLGTVVAVLAMYLLCRRFVRVRRSPDGGMLHRIAAHVFLPLGMAVLSALFAWGLILPIWTLESGPPRGPTVFTSYTIFLVMPLFVALVQRGSEPPPHA